MAQLVPNAVREWVARRPPPLPRNGNIRRKGKKNNCKETILLDAEERNGKNGRGGVQWRAVSANEKD